MIWGYHYFWKHPLGICVILCHCSSGCSGNMTSVCNSCETRCQNWWCKLLGHWLPSGELPWRGPKMASCIMDWHVMKYRELYRAKKRTEGIFKGFSVSHFIQNSLLHAWKRSHLVVASNFQKLNESFARQHFLTSACSTHFSSREHFLLVLRCSTLEVQQGQTTVIYYWNDVKSLITRVFQCFSLFPLMDDLV